ncbi:MAG: peptidoglycan DD-metalloendopeptidase family protein, partial [Sedimentisphaerales bacterium]|nr:peptidoglycan DD-metalloendopeptidase family protein [Sedimentisphaerales bacterium]
MVEQLDGRKPGIRLANIGKAIGANWDAWESFIHNDPGGSPFLGIKSTEAAAARWGYLWLKNGRWKEKRIVDEEYVKRTIEPMPSPNGGYAHPYEGWQIHLNRDGAWSNIVPHDAYAALGANTRLILVIPSLNIIYARSGPERGFGWIKVNGYRVLNLGPHIEHVVRAVLNDSTSNPTNILSPAKGSNLTEGNAVTLKGEGDNLSWSYDADSDGKGTIPIGTGAQVVFNVPGGVSSPRTITITLSGNGGVVSQTYSLADIPSIRSGKNLQGNSALEISVEKVSGKGVLAETSASDRVILNQPGWPTIFELNLGDSYALRRNIDGKTIERVVKLISVTDYWEPDYWIKNNPRRRTLRKAEVVVDVSGVKATLLARPYQMPTVVNGLRLYVEATHRWATETQLGKIRGMDRDVRLSAVAQGEGWGPSDMLFPLKDYRWRSSSYFNTWSSLVPYNLLYYHRGEDYGAIPDRLPVIAILPGKITGTPLPGGNRRSNGVTVETASGFRFRCSHMNIETFDRALTAGTQVRAGQMIAKTGMTWDGRKSQHHDPHLHIGFHFGRTSISTYPFLIEAYLRMYDDEVMAVAGAYHFAVPGEPVELDGSRSIPRAGRKITEYEWRLHDGRIVKEPQLRLVYDKPGLYCEELI